MLDIRAILYPSPLSEVDFESVVLTVRLKNYADETGEVTGTFRVYNDTTGLLIHTSEIEPVTVAAGVTVDVSALTDFDPPAPADDVYFVIFDGVAVNALVPDGISFHRAAWYFDVKPVGMGPAPAAHHGTHEDTGSDEIDVTGLSGLLADEQTPLAHAASHEAGGADEIALLSETPQTLTDQAAIDWDLADGAVATVTLGCKVNQYETEFVRQGLFQAGYQEADADERADLCVVNTCTVTHEGDAKSRQLIRRLHRDNPDARIVVMGCYATRAPEELTALPGVSVFAASATVTTVCAVLSAPAVPVPLI
jgi:hypothetical protein